MVNKTLRKTVYAIAATAFGSTFLVGCVDNSYDLSKDMDLNATIGGQELNLPVSSTAALTMKDILDLNEDESSIKEAKEGEYGLHAGDYVLVQGPDGEPTKTDVEIALVDIDESGLSGSESESVIEFPLVDMGAVEMPTKPITTLLNIKDDNVDPQLLSISEATTEVVLNVKVTFSSEDYHGIASIKTGTKAKFSDRWFLSITDPETMSYARIEDDHTVLFTQDKEFHGGQSAGFTLVINVVKFELGSNKEEGLYAPGHFDMESAVEFEGHMEIQNEETRPGEFATIRLNTATSVESAVLRTVTGKVNPTIDVDPTSVEIKDIPDFLADKDNNLDILNPQIKIDVTNASPVEAFISAKIVATYPADSEKQPMEVTIGDEYKKAPIKLNGDGLTKLCLTQTGDVESGYTPVVVPELSSLLKTIPEKLEVSDINVKANTTKEVTITLGDKYHFETAYEAVVPFQFGPDMVIHYNTTEDNWDTDLDSYNFGSVVLSMDVVNTTPLGMTPEIIALDKDGKEINDVTCTFTPKDNAIKANSTSSISAELKSNGNNLGKMAGVQINFAAKTGAEGKGKTLNANQSLKLNNIKVSIKGGITVDLNEL